MFARFFLILSSVTILLVGVLPFQIAQAAYVQIDDSTVIANEAIVSYPEKVTFRLQLDPSVTIVDASLTYDVEQVSCLDVSSQVPVEVDGDTLEWEWVMIRSGNPPPGATMWWEWNLTDDQGQTYTTPRQSLTFRDDRFNWRTVQEDGVTLHWYAGDAVGPLLLEAAVDGLQLLEKDMGIELQEAVEFYIYGSPEEMRDAVLYIQDWAGGVAFSEYNIILMGVPPSIAEEWGRDTIRHELAHLVVGQLGRSCVGGYRPNWLEEGLAMYAEGEPSTQVQRDLEDATRNNSFIPLRSLNGPFPAHGDDASLAYSQSYSVISFMREVYGPQKIAELIETLATGEGYDKALEQVYGFNVDGLEQAWRQWLGLPARDIPPTMTPISAAAIPTLAPLSGPVDVPTPDAVTLEPAQQQPAPSALTNLCAIGLIPLALLGAFSWQSRKKGRSIDAR